MKTINTRSTEYPINDLFLKRYSPRAFSGESLSKEDIMTLFEAARWAPSSRNFQSWRFIYTNNKSVEFENFLNFLTESNRVWCAKASILVVVLSKNTYSDGTNQRSHSLETGMAVQNLLLQATEMDLVSHPMGGFLEDIIREKLNISSDYTVECMMAIGKPGNPKELSEFNQSREVPSQRKPLEEIAFEEKFTA